MRGMQGLDPAVEHLGEAGVILRRRVTRRPCSASSRAVPPLESDLDVERREHAAQLDDAFLVVNADERPAHSLLHYGGPCLTPRWPSAR